MLRMKTYQHKPDRTLVGQYIRIAAMLTLAVGVVGCGMVSIMTETIWREGLRALRWGRVWIREIKPGKREMP